MPHFARGLVRAARCGPFQFVGLFLVFEFQEVRYIEEGVALEADVDKCRLHAGQHSGYTPFVDGPCEGVFVLAFEVDLGEQIIFHQAHF